MTQLHEQLKRIMSQHDDPANPINRDDLCALLPEYSDRAIRAAIAELQQEGLWVVSLNKGYYWARDREQVDAYVRREKQRAISILNKLRGFVPKSQGIVEQLELL